MLKFRRVIQSDLMQLYEWANDVETRENSFNSRTITLQEHSIWFQDRLNNINYDMLVFFENKLPVGLVRLQEEDEANSLIGIVIDRDHRGKGLSSKILVEACQYFHKINPKSEIKAYIKKNNIPSFKAFEKAGFVLENEIFIDGQESYLFIKHS